MKILIIGSGGREHALAWKCAQSPQSSHVYVAPGNAGTALEPGVSNININPDDADSLIQFAHDESVGLTIVGPEVPLVEGLVDKFRQADLQVFGPTAAAAKLEGSKEFSKIFMAEHNIPTARFRSFSEVEAACSYLEEHPLPVVIKADGLAAGKGVIIAESLETAKTTVADMLSGNAFGEAGHRVVIEEFMTGEEASFICLVNGREALALATSQDHKARDDGDQGPNTGGMGAYSPAPVVDADTHQHIMNDIILPTINALADAGAPYSGFLYAGLMIENSKARVVEFNVRLGDPETQPLLMRLQSDLVEVCLNTLAGKLASIKLQWRQGTSIGVVLAAGGYPAAYGKGHVISGLDQIADYTDDNSIKVFHAGTTLKENASGDSQIVTSGGRVLCVVACAEDIKSAQTSAYQACKKIHWQDMYHRHDIGYRAIARMEPELS